MIDMKKALKSFSLVIAIVLIFSACGNSGESIPTTETTSSYNYQEPITFAPESTDAATDSAPATESAATEAVVQNVEQQTQSPVAQAPQTEAPTRRTGSAQGQQRCSCH